MYRYKALIFLVPALALLWVGCNNSRSCDTDDDCFSGEVCLDSVCVPQSGNNGGQSDAGESDGGSDAAEDDGATNDSETMGDADSTSDDTTEDDTGTTGPRPTDIEAGAKITCALFDNGEVWCWGYNENDLLNVGSTLEKTPYPSPVEGLPSATAIELGFATACALSDAGEVWCWGENRGFISGEDDRDIIEPTAGPFSGVVELRAGSTGGCALLEGRQQMVCWGNAPAAPDFDTEVIDFAVGSSHACAVIEGGDIRCWSSSNPTQIGADDPIRGIFDVVAIDAARGYNCAVKTDGSVWCWGDNWYGNLGEEDQSSTREPVEVPSIDSAVDIATGTKYACAILDNGGIKCWGEFRENDGSYELFHPPMSIYPLVSGVDQMDTGHVTSCALKSDGEVWCWGENHYEQLGRSDLSTTAKGEPVRVHFD